MREGGERREKTREERSGHYSFIHIHDVDHGVPMDYSSIYPVHLILIH